MPALGEDAGVSLGHLAADDRLGAGGVRLLLAAREREDARRAVLDRDGGVEQRRDRVRDGEEVARRQAADRLALGVADVAVGEERAQQRGQLRPGRAAGEAEHGHAGAAIAARASSSMLDGRPHDEGDGAVRRRARATSGAIPSRVDADAEDERARRVGGLVQGVVDHDAADVRESRRRRRGRDRAACGRGRRGRGAGSRGAAGSCSGA